MRCATIGLPGDTAAQPIEKLRALLCQLFLGLAALLCSVVPLAAQNQHLVYVSNAATSQIYGWVVDPVLGTLTPVPNSPFVERELLDPYAIAVHSNGKFLYAVNKAEADVSAFSIDPVTGALTELTASPFGTNLGSGTEPIAVAVDSSGKFLCVLNAMSDESSGEITVGSMDSYSIDQNTGALTPVNSIDLDDPPIDPLALLVDPGTEKFYVVGNNGELDTPGEMVATVSIDPNARSLSQANTESGQSELDYAAAISPNGESLFWGLGQNEGEIVLYPNNFLYTTAITGNHPIGMAVDSTGSYIYVEFFTDSSEIHSFSLTGPFAEVPASPFAAAEYDSPIVADPLAPFLYSEGGGAYQISPSGALTPIPGFTTPGAITGIGTYGPLPTPVQPIASPVATFVPGSLSFDSQAVGTTSTSQEIMLSNTGSANLSISGVSITGANAADFALQANNCLAILAPAPATGCSLTITFRPSVASGEQALLTVSDNVAGGSSSAALGGSGFTPAPAVRLVPGSLIFPSTLEGASAAGMLITVTNSGTAALLVSANGVSLTGPNPGDFSQANTCSGTTVAVQRTCTIQVIFRPVAAGARVAQVQISDGAGGSPQAVALSGTGTSAPVPAVTSTPGSLTFPATTEGSSSVAMPITVTNSGTAALYVSANGVTMTGVNPGDFSQTNTCNGSVVAPQGNCMIMAVFQPTATGTRSAQIQISDNAGGSPQSILLSGNGVSAPVQAPAVTLAPTNLSFPATSTNASSSAMSISVTNSGTAALHVAANGVALAGADPGDFSQTNTCNGITVPVGASCTVAVTFEPTAAGTRSAQLQISDDAAGAIQFAGLSGTGAAAPFTLGIASSGTASQTVTAGATAQYNLQIVPQGGFTGVVSLSCAVSPSNPVCSVPSTVQVTGVNPVPFVVTVTTTASSGAPAFRLRSRKPGGYDWIGWAEWGTLFAGLGLLIVMFRYPDKTFVLRRGVVGGAMIAMLLILSAVLVSCGSSASPNAPASILTGTPAGSYAVTVTASVGTVSEAVNLTLIVP